MVLVSPGVLKKCQYLSRDTGFCTLARIAFAHRALKKHTIIRTITKYILFIRPDISDNCLDIAVVEYRRRRRFYCSVDSLLLHPIFKN
jgi:hypothetical protein